MAGKHRAPRRSQRTTETSDYVAMLTRIIAAYGDRVAADPVALAHLRDLQTALTDQVNRGIFQASRSSAHYSQNEIARIPGVSRQAWCPALPVRAPPPSAVFHQQVHVAGASLDSRGTCCKQAVRKASR
jgi:hypothetical protein